MRVLVVGSTGMLGSDVVAELKRRGHEVLAPSSSELDIADPGSVARVAAGGFGQAIAWCVNCAAYTAVDRAEEEVDRAFALNALGPGYLAQACLMSGIRLLQMSTDFVFDGAAREPYSEDAPAHPLGVYGESKLQGEASVLTAHPGSIVVRTSWLFGPNGSSFPRTMILAWLADKPLRVVSDQIGSPSYTGELARVLADFLEREAPPGIYHAAGNEAKTWHELAVRSVTAYRDVVLKNDAEISIEAIRSDEFPTLARRPAYSVLNSAKMVGLSIRGMAPLEASLSEFVGRLPFPP